jgi:adenylate cyclase class 2
MSNKIEQEAKFYISNPVVLEKRLQSMGATLKQPRTLEKNLRFDTPDRRLAESFQTLRLRQDRASRLTFKGASDPEQEVSFRRELEVEISDLETAQAILEALGFEVFVRYEKYRSAYQLGDVEVSVDEMPFGRFCEIEGPDTTSIERTAHTLGLDWEARSKFSYLVLFANLKALLGLNFNDLTFEAFKGLNISAPDLGMRPADTGN